MKKSMPMLLVVLMLFTQPSSPQERADIIEAFTPASAICVVKTSRLNKFMTALNKAIQKYFPQKEAESIANMRSKIKSNTGVDLLDVESLKKAGIDTSRTASFAVFPKGARGEGQYLIFLPVNDVKTFPLAFIEFYRKSSRNKKEYPVITPYRDFTIYQIERDIFITSFDATCAIGSTGEIIRKVIDAKTDNTGYLAVDPRYADYLNRNTRRGDLSVYLTKEFLKEAISKSRRQKSEGGGTEQQAPKEDETEIDRFMKGPSSFNAVDYASLELSATGTRVDASVSIKFNEQDPSVNAVMNIIRIGAAGNALYLRGAATYIFLSLDLPKFEEFCSGNATGCRSYQNFKNTLHQELGIDIAKDIAPFINGPINIIAGQPKGAEGGFCLYLPLRDNQSKKVWDASAAYLKNKFQGTERFGVSGAKTYWYIDGKNVRTSVAWSAKGIYLSNDPALLNQTMAAKDMTDAPADDALAARLGKNVFFLAMIKKDSFFGALLSLYANREPLISPLVNQMEELWVIGEKSGLFVTFEASVHIRKKK